MALAVASISRVGARPGIEVPRAPLRKSAICWRKYSTGSPARLAFGAASPVARAAGEHLWPAPLRHHLGHGRMIIRVPVRREEQVADLRQGEGSATFRHVPRIAVIGWR